MVDSSMERKRTFFNACSVGFMGRIFFFFGRKMVRAKVRKKNVKNRIGLKVRRRKQQASNIDTIQCKEENQEYHENSEAVRNERETCSGDFKKRMLSNYSAPKKKRYRKDDPRKIPCKVCNRRFTFNYLLKIHFHNDIDMSEYICSLCGEIYSSEDDLKTHKTNIHAEEAARLQCDECGKQYTYEGDLSRHIKTKHEGFIYKCEVCEKSFNNNQSLKEHILVKHDESYVKPKYPCTFCDKHFSCKKTLMLHVKNIHYGLRHFYICDMCGKSLATPNSFRNHLRTHTNDKPFPCTVCGKRFGRNHHLQDHLVTHTKEKPHSCTKCGKAFTQRAPLLRHMKCVHETARPYQCLICSKSFATKSLVHTHAKLHNVIN
ncbi:hypothetical protein HHI36_018431 [Cryptolaemus montrouzieri]|uniref:C2H2-type domain-containing protein n=1 Tax=Cryptolaemus montrouzieri TaxID=559131 RepID=A0ABD2P0A7_9CUCU